MIIGPGLRLVCLRGVRSFRMRSIWQFAVLTVLLMVPSVAIGAEEDFAVDGGGWGHGVGMSQYGAYGMAVEDPSTTADEIIDHFYNGASPTAASSLSTVPAWIFGPEALAVNVASRRTDVDFVVETGSVDVCHRGDGTETCDAPDVIIGPGETLRLQFEDLNVCLRSKLDSDGVVVEGTETAGNCVIDLTWEDSFSGTPATTVRVPDPADNPDLEYVRGPFQVRPSVLEGFDVTVRLGLEEYLYGIAEMPLSWPVETLKAQAITARSYAVNTVAHWGGSDGSGRRPDCGCHIRRTVADQNYDAWLVEGSTHGAKWRTQAVDASAGLVVTHPQVAGGDEVVTTYYSSSTGGATENVEDVFGGSPQPHLVSVDDPWGADPGTNPLARWQRTVSESVLRSRLCQLGPCWDAVSGAEMVTGPPGARIRLIGLVGRDLVSTEVTATWLYTVLRDQGNQVSPYITGVTAPTPFLDIGTSIHRDSILYIAEIGITRGCNPPANDMFCPTDPVTRQQMASFLVRALGLPASSGDKFADDAESIHQDSINALAAAGITLGCNPPANDRFCPGDLVTRDQMAAFLVRAFAYADPGGGNLFVDDDGSTFEGDIDRLATAGVTRGCNPPDNTRYCPRDPVTREAMASFLLRALQP